MSDALPLPALPAAATPPAVPSAPAAPTVTVVSAGSAAPATPIELLSTVTDAHSLFGALMTIANATPATKDPLAAKLAPTPTPTADDDDPAVAVDPIAAALLALPVIPSTGIPSDVSAASSPGVISSEAGVIPSEARDILKLSLDASHPGMTQGSDLPTMSPDASRPGVTPDNAPQNPAPAPKLELSIQMLPTLPAMPADPASHHAQAADVTPAGNTPASIASAQIQLPLPAAANVAPPQAPDVTVPPSHPRWAEQVAASVVWCVKQKLTEAEVRLHPPELGPVRVTLRIDHDSVDVRFVAASPITRDALEQTLPQLRDLFQQQGLSLGQAQVGDSAANARDRMPQLQPVSPVAPDASGEVPLNAATVQLKRSGLLDEYA